MKKHICEDIKVDINMEKTTQKFACHHKTHQLTGLFYPSVLPIGGPYAALDTFHDLSTFTLSEHELYPDSRERRCLRNTYISGESLREFLIKGAV